MMKRRKYSDLDFFFLHGKKKNLKAFERIISQLDCYTSKARCAKGNDKAGWVRNAGY